MLTYSNELDFKLTLVNLNNHAGRKSTDNIQETEGSVSVSFCYSAIAYGAGAAMVNPRTYSCL